MSDNTAVTLMLIALFVFLGWVARHKRSLGRNKQFRACVRLQHEVRKEMEKLNKQAEAAQASSASTIARRVNEFLQSVPRLFTRRSAKA